MTEPIVALAPVGVDNGAFSHKRGARINTISPGIIITPLAKDKVSGP